MAVMGNPKEFCFKIFLFLLFVCVGVCGGVCVGVSIKRSKVFIGNNLLHHSSQDAQSKINILTVLFAVHENAL